MGLTALYYNLSIHVSFAVFIPAPSTYCHLFIYVTNILRIDHELLTVPENTKVSRIRPVKPLHIVLHWNYKTQKIK